MYTAYMSVRRLNTSLQRSLPEELTEVGVDEVLVSFCFTVALD